MELSGSILDNIADQIEQYAFQIKPEWTSNISSL